MQRVVLRKWAHILLSCGCKTLVRHGAWRGRLLVLQRHYSGERGQNFVFLRIYYKTLN